MKHSLVSFGAVLALAEDKGTTPPGGPHVGPSLVDRATAVIGKTASDAVCTLNSR